MNKIRIDWELKAIEVPIQLTAMQGKIRIKVRNTFADYGEPTATKQIPFGLRHYVEWQIGYDTPVNDDKFHLTTCQKKMFHFTGANGKTKTLYELSEYMFYFKKFGFINNNIIEDITNYAQSLNEYNFIENVLKISRDNFTPYEIANIKFMRSLVKYPILIHQFLQDNISEIIIREKQKAIGIQAMLYYCFPVLSLNSEKPLIGRRANIKEVAYLRIGKDNYLIFVEMLKIFSLLSKQHNKDIVEILKILKEV